MTTDLHRAAENGAAYQSVLEPVLSSSWSWIRSVGLSGALGAALAQLEAGQGIRWGTDPWPDWEEFVVKTGTAVCERYADPSRYVADIRQPDDLYTFLKEQLHESTHH